MLFNSYVFIFLFLPVALFFWWQPTRTWLRLFSLTLLSYVFYAWWDWRFVPLMIASTTVDYWAGNRIVATEDAHKKKMWLACSMTFNLAILGFFKYYDFIAGTANHLALNIGRSAVLPLLGITLPIGISFYTFNSMSYTIDLYRERVRPARSLLHFSTFVAMFPHLIAGPIVRFSDVEKPLRALPQWLDWEEIGRGIFFFTIGLAKKILVADRLAPFVNDYFSAPSGHGFAGAWIAVLGYTFQLYFDFSGYSDMAVGLAQLLGIHFPQNFNSPYKAVNVADFWRRWHISLSTWLRDYLFIPLGGSHGTRMQTLFNLCVTMFLGGLWHGANWTFVLWGLYHGVLLAMYYWIKEHFTSTVPHSLARIVTFVLVSLGWVIFRSDDLSTAAKIYGQLFGGEGWGHATILYRQISVLICAAAITQLLPNTFEVRLKASPRLAYGLAILFILSVLYLGKTSPFLYFQF